MAYVSTAKASPHPPAQLASWVVIPQHVAPNLKLLFPKYFSGTYGISVQFFFDWPIFSNGVPNWEVGSQLTQLSTTIFKLFIISQLQNKDFLQLQQEASTLTKNSSLFHYIITVRGPSTSPSYGTCPRSLLRISPSVHTRNFQRNLRPRSPQRLPTSSAFITGELSFCNQCAR